MSKNGSKITIFKVSQHKLELKEIMDCRCLTAKLKKKVSKLIQVSVRQKMPKMLNLKKEKHL